MNIHYVFDCNVMFMLANEENITCKICGDGQSSYMWGYIIIWKIFAGNIVDQLFLP